MGKCEINYNGNKIKKYKLQTHLINKARTQPQRSHMHHSSNWQMSSPNGSGQFTSQSPIPITHGHYCSTRGENESGHDCRVRYLGDRGKQPSIQGQHNKNQNAALPLRREQNRCYYPGQRVQNGIPNSLTKMETSQKQMHKEATKEKTDKINNAKSLQSAILSHTNPIYRKISKSRPNSEDNKYQYHNAHREQYQRSRCESESKARTDKQEEETTIVSQGEGDAKQGHGNKSPYKPSYHQYHNNSGRGSQASTPPKSYQVGPRMGEEKFLQKCLQHIMIQNSCLTKQVVVKQMELTRLRQELQKLRSSYSSYKKTKLNIETLGNMSVIISANEDESQLDQSQCSISDNCGDGSSSKKREHEAAKKWIKKQAISENQCSRESSKDITFSIENKQQQGLKLSQNLSEIQDLISEIENEERKLEQVETQSPPGRREDSLQGEQEQERRERKAEQEQGHRMEGMQFTRLDRLRMKKGIVSKREHK